MATDTRWQPFGIDDEAEEMTERRGVRVVNLTLRRPKGARDDQSRAGQSDAWLRSAMVALGLLATAAAVVSFEAQYRMVFAAKDVAPIAALEAAIPDVAALVFASLGIALALHGRQAIRARVLNIGAVATSIAMNMLAAGHGFRDLAIWIMPPIAYALASDTAIGVIRSHAIARQRELREALAGDETTPLAILVGAALWMLRLVLAAPSTLQGFRSWIVDSSPVAPGVAPAAVTAANESAAKAIESAHAAAGQEITAAAQARDVAVSRAQDAEHQASAARQAAAAVQAELQRTRQDFAQLASALQRAEDERAHLGGIAQELQTALAGQRAEAAGSARTTEAARSEAQRVREDAARQAAQLREDFGRERAEYRESLAGMRETTQALDEDRRQLSQERDGLQAELAALRAAQRAGGAGRRPAGRPRGESKRAQLIEAYEALAGTDARYGDRSKASQVARELAAEVGMEWGSARGVLYRHLDARAEASS